MRSGELAVVACYFNPCGYRSRERNLRTFLDGLRRQGVHLFLAELAFDTGAFVVPTSDEHVTVIPFHGRDLLWHKERLINLVVERLPPRYRKIAWVDTDIVFDDDAWYERAERLLDDRALIQLFQSATQLDNEGNVVGQVAGLAWYVAQGKPDPFKFDRSGAWPGLAWAARRDVLSRHGLFDRLIVGGGDTYMSLAAFGLNNDPRRWHARQLPYRLRRAWRGWAAGFGAELRDGVGYLDTAISQLGHGSLAGRRYVDRLRILTSHRFDPDDDIVADSNGLWRWSSPKPGLHDAVRDYFWSRAEDD